MELIAADPLTDGVFAIKREKASPLLVVTAKDPVPMVGNWYVKPCAEKLHKTELFANLMTGHYALMGPTEYLDIKFSGDFISLSSGLRDVYRTNAIEYPTCGGLAGKMLGEPRLVSIWERLNENPRDKDTVVLGAALPNYPADLRFRIKELGGSYHPTEPYCQFMFLKGNTFRPYVHLLPFPAGKLSFRPLEKVTALVSKEYLKKHTHLGSAEIDFFSKSKSLQEWLEEK